MQLALQFQCYWKTGVVDNQRQKHPCRYNCRKPSGFGYLSRGRILSTLVSHRLLLPSLQLCFPPSMLIALKELMLTWGSSKRAFHVKSDERKGVPGATWARFHGWMLHKKFMFSFSCKPMVIFYFLFLFLYCRTWRKLPTSLMNGLTLVLLVCVSWCQGMDSA